MHATLYFVVKLLHVAAASLWLGGPPVAVFGLRRSLAAGPEVSRALFARLIAVTPLFIGAALATVATGTALVWFAGGFARVPLRISVGAALVVPIFAVGGAVNRPALLRLERHFAGGGEVGAAEPDLRRFLLAHRIEQALRLSALVLMVVPW